MDTRTLESPARKLGTHCCDAVDAPLNAEVAQQFSQDLQILPYSHSDSGDAGRQRRPSLCLRSGSGVPVKQPTVSHHLKLLRDAGLIDCERRGVWAYYFVDRPALAALRARIMGPLDALA